MPGQLNQLLPIYWNALFYEQSVYPFSTHIPTHFLHILHGNLSPVLLFYAFLCWNLSRAHFLRIFTLESKPCAHFLRIFTLESKPCANFLHNFIQFYLAVAALCAGKTSIITSACHVSAEESPELLVPVPQNIWIPENCVKIVFYTMSSLFAQFSPELKIVQKFCITHFFTHNV